MNKAIVIGGAGFIGSNVVDRIVNSNFHWDEILVIDNLSTGKKNNINSKAKFIFADIRNLEEIEPHFVNATCIWHLAALPRVEPSIHDPITFNDINVNGTLNVFMAAKKHGVKNIVFSSSSSVYGEPKNHPTNENEELNPMSPYALQKLHGEQYAKLFCELYGMNICCLRYFNVYGNREPTEGPYVPVIGIWLRQIRQGKKLTITGDGKQTRDFVNVLNVADANYMVGCNIPTGFSVFNVGSGKNYELNKVARWICQNESNIEYIAPRIEPKITLADIKKLTNNFGKENLVTILDLEQYIKEGIKK